MADINEIVTLGIGTPSSIKHFILLGLNVGAAVTIPISRTRVDAVSVGATSVDAVSVGATQVDAVSLAE